MSDSIISRETFEKSDPETRLRILFDVSYANYKALQRLEKRKKVDTTYAVMAGGVGGFLAMIGRTLLGK